MHTLPRLIAAEHIKTAVLEEKMIRWMIAQYQIPSLDVPSNYENNFNFLAGV